jgi:hypothetical protein
MTKDTFFDRASHGRATVRDRDLPHDMKAKPEEGDIEECFCEVIPDFDTDRAELPPLDDGAILDDIRRSEARLRQGFDAFPDPDILDF